MKSIALSLTLLIFFVCDIDAQILLVIDADTGEPLPFASYHAPNFGCSGRASNRGELNVDQLQCDTIIVDMLGYRRKAVALSDLRNTTKIYLKPEAYTLDYIDIVARKTDIVREINQALRDIRQNRKNDPCASFFFLETTQSDTLLERVEAVTLDQRNFVEHKQQRNLALLTFTGLFNSQPDIRYF
jgi:hypothetical protein